MYIYKKYRASVTFALSKSILLLGSSPSIPSFAGKIETESTTP
jgi:hypothetical protein